MRNEEQVLLPGIERSSMGSYISKENMVTRYDVNGTPKNRTFSEQQIEVMNQALKPK